MLRNRVGGGWKGWFPYVILAPSLSSPLSPEPCRSCSVCGNDLCEASERCVAGGGPCCPQDCPVPQLVCTVTAAGVCSGRGVCAPTIGGGVCLCHPGYAGGSCDSCAGGFTSVGGACSAAAAIPVVVPFVCTTTYGFPNRMRCVQWWWWLILAAVALLLLLLLCIACRCCCFRKKKQPKRASLPPKVLEVRCVHAVWGLHIFLLPVFSSRVINGVLCGAVACHRYPVCIECIESHSHCVRCPPPPSHKRTRTHAHTRTHTHTHAHAHAHEHAHTCIHTLSNQSTPAPDAAPKRDPAPHVVVVTRSPAKVVRSLAAPTSPGSQGVRTLSLSPSPFRAATVPLHLPLFHTLSLAPHL